MDGFDLISRLRLIRNTNRVKILVITGKELSMQELNQLEKLNTSGILYKPFDSERLIEIVKNTLNNSTEHQK